MKIERFAGFHEAREALVLASAGVTAIIAGDEYNFDDLALGACRGRRLWNDPGLCRQGQCLLWHKAEMATTLSNVRFWG